MFELAPACLTGSVFALVVCLTWFSQVFAKSLDSSPAFLEGGVRDTCLYVAVGRGRWQPAALAGRDTVMAIFMFLRLPDLKYTEKKKCCDIETLNQISSGQKCGDGDRSHLLATGATCLTLVLVHVSPPPISLAAGRRGGSLRARRSRKRWGPFQKGQGCLWWEVTVAPRTFGLPLTHEKGLLACAGSVLSIPDPGTDCRFRSHPAGQVVSACLQVSEVSPPRTWGLAALASHL